MFMYFKTVQCMPSRFSRVCLCATLWTAVRQALCPWDSPGKNIGVGCHALLQGILLTQVSNLCLLHLPALVGGFFSTTITWEAQDSAEEMYYPYFFGLKKIKNLLTDISHLTPQTEGHVMVIIPSNQNSSERLNDFTRLQS